MDMSFGKKHKGKAVAWVLLNDPSFFDWMNSKNMQDKEEYQFMLRLKQTIDAKPFSGVKCCGSSCNKVNTPTRLSLYNGKYNGQYWFCDTCDLYEQGANSGKLSSISTYDEFVRGNKDIIEAYKKAKEVPFPMRKDRLKNYFGY